MRKDFTKGFSTIELMIAFALMSLVFSGVILAHFASAYWAEAFQTSNEGLYIAKTDLEEMRAVVKDDFRMASSSPMAKVNDADCSSGGLCYFLTTDVSDLSPCSKYVTAEVDWQVDGYPTTTTSLFTNLTDTDEAINLGGDCPLASPEGSWANLFASTTFPTALSGNAQAIDALGGVLYVGTDASPYLQILTPAGASTFANGFALPNAVDAIDVARDLSTGRTYAYLAMASTTLQFSIVDVTDARNPSLVSSFALPGTSGAEAQGWRIAVYAQTAYVSVRDSAGPELHVIDVSTPSNPAEKGSIDLATSIYDMVVREQKINGTLKRYLFAATTLDQGEVKVIDVTDSSSPSVAATLDLPENGCGLSDAPNGKAVFLAGNTLYVGRDHSPSCASLPALYAIDISNPLSPHITSSAVSNSVIGLESSGGYLYALTSTSANPDQGGLLDIDGDAVFAGKSGTDALRVWKLNEGQLPAAASATFNLPASGGAFAIQSQ